MISHRVLLLPVMLPLTAIVLFVPVVTAAPDHSIVSASSIRRCRSY